MTLCDHVVALDGAYEGFVDSPARSSSEEVRAITEGCSGRCTIDQARPIWADQMTKRTALFELGAAQTNPSDWYFVFDADDRVVYAASDIRNRLAATHYDVAVYTLGGDRYHRGIFRAFRSLRVEDAHYHYLAERDGETIHLRGNDAVHRLEPFLNLTDLQVEHRTAERDIERKAKARAYRRFAEGRAIEKSTPEQWAA